MATVIKEESAPGFKEALGQGIGNFITSGAEAYQNRSDQEALQKAIGDLGPNASAEDIMSAILKTKTYKPKAKQELFENYLGKEKFAEVRRHAKKQEEIAEEKNHVKALGKMNPEEQQAAFLNFKARGYTDNESQAMVSPYVKPGTKQQISRNVEDEIARGIRQPQQPQEANGAANPEQNIAPQQEPPLKIEESAAPVLNEAEKEIAKIEPVPEVVKEEWPTIPEPEGLKPAEKVKWRDKNQTFNRKELKDLRSKNQANTDARIHYSRLRELNDTGKVQNGVSRLLIDPDTGEPYKDVQKLQGVNKETQLYIKTLNDFISQAKNFFGARVTNFDLTAFKSRLPSLLNTEEGRRAIIEQMSLLTELQSAHDTTLAEGIKHYGDKASYIDIVKEADEKVSAKEEKIINKINNLDTATKYMDMMQSNPKYKGLEMMFNPDTNKFIAVRPNDIEKVKKQGYEAWRTPL